MPEAARQIEPDDGPSDDELMAIEAEAASSDKDEPAGKQAAARRKAWTGPHALSPEEVEAYEELQELFEQTPPACRGASDEVFFPERGASTREAKALCKVCEVKPACLNYALVAKEKHGIWGGTSERQRRRLRRQKARERRQQEKLYLQALAAASPVDNIEPVAVLPIKQVSPEQIKCVETVDSGDYQSAVAVDAGTEKVSNWIEHLTGDPSRRRAVYAKYKSGTHLARSDQPRPVKVSWPKAVRQAASPDVFSTKRRQSSQRVVAFETTETPEESHVTSDDSAITATEIDWPTNVRKADLIELCEVLASQGGTIRSPSGLVKSELKSLGLNYTTLGTTMKAAEDCGLIKRDIRGKRTFVIALTAAGWQLVKNQAGSEEEIEPPDDHGEVTPNPDVEEDEAGEATATEAEDQPTSPGTEAEAADQPLTDSQPMPSEPEVTATQQQPESDRRSFSFGELLVAEAFDMANDMAKLVEQLKQTEQQLADLSERCESLEQENQRLKHILGGLKSQLQDVLP